MLEELKQIGILIDKNTQCDIVGEDIKLGNMDQMSKEQLEAFCEPLEVLLVALSENDGRMERLIEECPCALAVFGEEEPEILNEKYDGTFVRVAPCRREKVLEGFAMLMQQTLAEGFEEFGEVEDIISRFTGFSLCEIGDVSEDSSLLLWLGSGILSDSEEKQHFLKKAEEYAALAEESGMEFYCSHSPVGKTSAVLLEAVEKAV